MIFIKDSVIEKDAQSRGSGFQDAMRGAGVPAPGGIQIELEKMIGVFSAFPQEPSLVQKAVNVSLAGARMVGAAISGNPFLVPDYVTAMRGGYCAVCPLWMVDKGTCSKCGCKGLKLNLATERCPMGYWDRLV